MVLTGTHLRVLMSHNKTLISEITDKAKATWIDPVDPVAFPDKWMQLWEQHWIDTGKAWRDELAKEGLSSTVKGLDKVINYFEGLIKERVDKR